MLVPVQSACLKSDATWLHSPGSKLVISGDLHEVCHTFQEPPATQCTPLGGSWSRDLQHGLH